MTYNSINFAVGVLVGVRSILTALTTYLDGAPRPHLAVWQRLAHGEDVSLVHAQVVRLRARVLEVRAHEERVTHAAIVDDVIVALPAVTDQQVHLAAHAHQKQRRFLFRPTLCENDGNAATELSLFT